MQDGQESRCAIDGRGPLAMTQKLFSNLHISSPPMAIHSLTAPSAVTVQGSGSCMMPAIPASGSGGAPSACPLRPPLPFPSLVRLQPAVQQCRERLMSRQPCGARGAKRPAREERGDSKPPS